MLHNVCVERLDIRIKYGRSGQIEVGVGEMKRTEDARKEKKEGTVELRQ